MEKSTQPVYETGYIKEPLQITAQGNRWMAHGFLSYKLTKEEKFVPLCIVHTFQKIALSGKENTDKETSEDAQSALLRFAHEVLPKGTRYKLPNSNHLVLIVNIGTEARPKYMMTPSIDEFDGEETVNVVQ